VVPTDAGYCLDVQYNRKLHNELVLPVSISIISQNEVFIQAKKYVVILLISGLETTRSSSIVLLCTELIHTQMEHPMIYILCQR